MKKILLSLLTLLMLGGNLAWGLKVSGTITIDAPESAKSQLNDIKLIVGLYMSIYPKDLGQVSEFSLPALSYDYSSQWPTEQYYITFALGTAKECVNPANSAMLAQDWVIVGEDGEEFSNPMTTANQYRETTMNLTIKYKGGGGGGGNDDTKATLIGRVGDGTTNCLGGVSVEISAIGYSVQSTKYDPSKYDGKVGCSYGYEFTNLDPGTYTLTYRKAGYETATQDVTISEAGETIAPPVTLMPIYTFWGSLTYTNTANEQVYVTNATVTAYDGPGADANVLGTTTSDGSADWNMTFKCQSGITVYFDATHPDIEVPERASVQAHYNANGIQVNIVCVPKGFDANKATLTLQSNNTLWGTVEGNGQYDKGTSVTAKAISNEGYTFVEWKEGETTVSTEAEYTFTLNEDRTLEAYFAELPPVVEQVTLELGFNDGAMGSVEGAGAYDKGTSVTAKAIPNEGYRFVEWKEGETTPSTDAEYTFTLNENRSLTAWFEAIPPVVVVKDSFNLELHVDATMGRVEGNGRYEENTEVLIKAVANEGYKFQAWKDKDQNTIATTAEHRVLMTQDSVLTAVFEADVPPVVVKDSFNLELNVDATMGRVEGAGRYEENTEVLIKAIANEGYKFQAWKDKYQNTIATTAEHRVLMTQDSVLTAVFEADVPPVVVKDSFNLELNVDATMGRVEGAGRYEKGQEVTIKAIANDGYVFRVWMEGDDLFAAEAEKTFILNENRTLTAVFVAETPVVKDSVTLRLAANDAVMGTVTGEGKFEKGSQVTVKATANKGYVFRAWMNGEELFAAKAEYTFTLNEDLSLTAVFAKETANEEREQAAWSVTVENQTLVLHSEAACQYDVYNMAGTLVEHAKTNAGQYRVAVNNSGLYIIRRISATGYSVKKVVVR